MLGEINRKELKQNAKQVLNNRWGKAALMTLVFSICCMGVMAMSGFILCIGPFLFIAILPVISFGFLKEWVLFYRNEPVDVADFFKLGFENFAKVWEVVLRVVLKFWKIIALVFVGGFAIALLKQTDSDFARVLSVCLFIGVYVWALTIYYKYMFAILELAFHPEKSATTIVEDTGNYMMGNRLKLFVLQ